MFQLLKIQNGRANIPEPSRLYSTASERFARGVPFRIRGGEPVRHKPTDTVLPTHMTYAAGGKLSLLFYEITPEMVFSVPVDGDPADMREGEEYALTEEGTISDAPVSGGARGATVVSLIGARKNGDCVMVRF